MLFSEPARPAARRTRSTVVAVVAAVSAVLVGALGYQSLASPSPSPSTASPSPSSAPGLLAPPPPPPGTAASSSTAPPPPPPRPTDPGAGETQGVLGEADGAVPDGVTVFDGGVPAVANLDPALLGALRRAASAAGVTFSVTSGWRSPAYQARLLREAVSTYGSEAAAARWVATPTTSPHVSGDAVDIGSTAAAWLSRHGAAYGLCRIYRNESWHYELRPEAVGRGCPPLYADPTHDPRMQNP
jgi:D-alanyl-D-alanine carboxypeptidase